VQAGGAAERQTCLPYEGDANLHLSNNSFFRISSDVGGREYLRSLVHVDSREITDRIKSGLAEGTGRKMNSAARLKQK
jgi:hypothetical protein